MRRSARALRTTACTCRSRKMTARAKASHSWIWVMVTPHRVAERAFVFGGWCPSEPKPVRLVRDLVAAPVTRRDPVVGPHARNPVVAAPHRGSVLVRALNQFPDHVNGPAGVLDNPPDRPVAPVGAPIAEHQRTNSVRDRLPERRAPAPLLDDQSGDPQRGHIVRRPADVADVEARHEVPSVGDRVDRAAGRRFVTNPRPRRLIYPQGHGPPPPLTWASDSRAAGIEPGTLGPPDHSAGAVTCWPTSFPRLLLGSRRALCNRNPAPSLIVRDQSVPTRPPEP